MSNHLLTAVKLCTERNGYPPTLRELGTESGLSATRVHQLLAGLRAAGLVTWEANLTRTIRLTQDGVNAVEPKETVMHQNQPTTHGQRILDQLDSYSGDLDTPAETIRADLKLIAERALQTAATLTDNATADIFVNPTQPARIAILDGAYPATTDPIANGLYSIATAIDRLRGPTQQDDNHLGTIAGTIAEAIGAELHVNITGGV